MNDGLQSCLDSALAIVKQQHEVVPFMQEYHPVYAMEFRPLPDRMLAVLRSSPDYQDPEMGKPVMLMLEADHASGGLVVVRVSGVETMFVLAPRKS